MDWLHRTTVLLFHFQPSTPKICSTDQLECEQSGFHLFQLLIIELNWVQHIQIPWQLLELVLLPTKDTNFNFRKIHCITTEFQENCTDTDRTSGETILSSAIFVASCHHLRFKHNKYCLLGGFSISSSVSLSVLYASAIMWSNTCINKALSWTEMWRER